jgi:hypothetical protein
VHMEKILRIAKLFVIYPTRSKELCVSEDAPGIAFLTSDNQCRIKQTIQVSQAS